MNPDFPIYTVYAHPSDYPEEFVVRRWSARTQQPDPEPCFRAATLEGVRAQLPPDLTRLSRHPDDDPVIVETWI